MKSTPNNPLHITSFDQLAGLVNQPVPCVFRLDNQLVTLDVQRISPQLSEQVRKLRRSVNPPFNPKLNPPDYDHRDPAYLDKKDALESKVRALIVYACCPVIAAQKPGLTHPDAMSEFVQGILTEPVLDLIMLTAMAGGMNVEEEVQRRANFISTPDSAS